MPLVRNLALTQIIKEDVGQINLETFVSIDSQVFRHMVAEFRGYLGDIIIIHQSLIFTISCYLIQRKWLSYGIVCVLPTTSSVMFPIDVKQLILEKEVSCSNARALLK